MAIISSRRRRLWVLPLALGLVLVGSVVGWGAGLPTVPVPGRPYGTLSPDGQIIMHPSRAVANRLIVRLRPTVSPQQVRPLVARGGGSIRSITPDGALMFVSLDPGTALDQAIAAYEAQPEVEYAAYDLLVYPTLVPNDPEYLNQYHHPLCDSPEAWDVTTGSSSVTIAVIDSGIDKDHPDLAGKLWINPGEIPGNGIDDDNNGYVDDVNGWDFVNSSNDVEPEPDGEDDDGNGYIDDNVNHGTFCSGLAAALGNDGYGVAGVDWGMRIMTCQVFPDDGPTSLTPILEAIYYAVDNGANVINMSLGGGYSTLYDAAISYAYNNRVLVVAAAGNEDWEFTDDSATWLSPVCNDGPNPYVDNYVLGVAATDANDRRASFSNYDGSSVNFVDVCAPGVDVYSSRYQNPLFPDFAEYFGAGSGTSFSCPITAGLAGLLLAERPERTPANLIGKIREGAKNIDSLNPQYAGKLGAGRINMADSLADMKPPEIEILSPLNNAAIYSTNPTIQATITDPESGVDVTRIRLQINDNPEIFVGDHYDSDTDFFSYGLTLSQGAHYHITLWAADNSGNDGYAEINFRILAKTFDAGLHLFSLPYTYNPGQFPSPRSLFGLAPGDVLNDVDMARWWPGDMRPVKYRRYPDSYGTFNPPDAQGGDPIVTSPPAGLGYFIRITLAPDADYATVSAPGISLGGTTSRYEIDLPYGANPPRGWHMIGCPFTSVLNWGSVQFITDGETQSVLEAVQDGVTDGVLWEFVSEGDGGHYEFPTDPLTATVEPFKGYWLHVWKDTTLVMFAPQVTGSAVAANAGADGLISDDGWQAQIIVSTGEHSDMSNYIGVSSQASAGYDPGLDIAEPPAVDTAVQCYQPRGDWEQYAARYARDIRPAAAGLQSWDMEVFCELSDVPVRVTWPQLNATVPPEIKLMLEDRDSGRQVFMRTASGYTFNSPEGGGVHHLRIVAYDETATSLTLAGISAQALSGSGGVVITYSVSKPAAVSAEICNISGVVIKRLGQRTSSGNQVEMMLWDGRSDRGSKVPSGRYLARITAQAADGQSVQAVRPFTILP